MAFSVGQQLPRLFVVRHGETEWTETGRHTGLTDIPLNEVGQKRASELAKRLSSYNFVKVFTSPLLRARQTCELADFEPKGEVSKKYGAYRAADGYCERALFVIDADGLIRWSYCSPVAVNPGADGILQALDDLHKPLGAQ